LLSAPTSLSTIALGVPFGATMAFQALKMKSTPASLVVGTSGSAVSRSGAATA